jgi:hypothetical protein
MNNLVELANELKGILANTPEAQHQQRFNQWSAGHKLKPEDQQAVIGFIYPVTDEPAEIDTELGLEIHLKGRTIQDVSKQKGVGLQYVPEASKKSLRVRRLFFRPSSIDVDFNKVEALKPNLVGHAGLSPSAAIMVVPGGVEIQDPLPKEQWQSVKFNDYLIDRLKRGPKPSIRNKRLCGWDTPPRNGFEYVAGVDLDGRAVILEEVIGILISGTKGSGKSQHTQSLLLQIMLQYKPSHYRLALFDAPGATFKDFTGSPWNWTEPHLGDSREDFIDGLESIREEALKRERLFKDNGVSSIEGWNEKFPANPVPRIGVVVEEYEESCDRFGFNEVSSPLAALSRANRKQGIDVIITTQTPKKDLFPPGLINNLETRVAFKAVDVHASRMAIGTDHASLLQGRGDGYVKNGDLPQRFQSLYVGSDSETRQLIERIIALGCQSYGEPAYSSTPVEKDPWVEDEDRQLYNEWCRLKVQISEGELTQTAAYRTLFKTNKMEGRAFERCKNTIAELERRFGRGQ